MSPADRSTLMNAVGGSTLKMAASTAMRPQSHNSETIALAQREWASLPIARRLAVLRRFRQSAASSARELAETIPTSLPGALNRTVADSLVSEVLPLLEACRFLEREAETILRTRRIGSEGRPLWLGRVDAEVERMPWGTVLILAAANYPLLLAGVQALQALAAGNAVLWKPAPGTEAPANALRLLLVESGLSPELLTILDSNPRAAADAITAGVDHVVLTGSAETGKAVSRQLAETLTPATMELSGSDAVFLLAGDESDRTGSDRFLEAILFGQRFNGSATCMAPRRLFLVGLAETEAKSIEDRLRSSLAALHPVPIPAATAARLSDLMEDARRQGAEIALNGLTPASSPQETVQARPTLILKGTPALLAAQADIFAPLLTVLRVANVEEAQAANAACPYALTASIFGPEPAARSFARHLRVGNVVINNLILPTADPRISFGGRGRSGYGVTRGAEGLLAMTTPRTIQIQHNKASRAYQPTGEHHIPLFTALIQLLHSAGPSRLRALRQLIASARKLQP